MMTNEKSVEPSITSKAELADVIDALRQNLLESPSEWENPTLDRFLDAMSDWVRSMDNYYRNVGREPPVTPSWAVFANILAAAKVYE